MLSEEQLDAIGVRYKATNGVRSLMWKGHQFVFRHPTIDEWDAHMRNQATGGGAASRQVSQVLLVAFDGETDITKARLAYNGFLAAGNAGFPNAPEVTMLLQALAGTVEEEDLANMGKAWRLWNGVPAVTPGASPNGSVTSSTAAS